MPRHHAHEAGTWISDITHYLEASGRVSAIPGPARGLADHFGAITVSLANTMPETVSSTPVPCRRHPGREPCPGRIQRDLGFAALGSTAAASVPRVSGRRHNNTLELTGSCHALTEPWYYADVRGAWAR